MKSILLFSILSLFSFLKINAQNNIQAGKMSFWSSIEKDSVLIKIKAPTKGWLAVGFNSQNQIVGSDLKMFCVKNNQIEAEDQFVKGVQSHPEDKHLEGMNNIRLIKGTEAFGETSIAFKIPLISNDPVDFQHSLDQEFWLILAYSVEDDFTHHSIMRKHFQIKWGK